MAMNILKAGKAVLHGLARGPRIRGVGVAPDYYQQAASAGMGSVLGAGFARMGIAGGLGFMSQFFFKRLQKAPPGAPITTGKRGIDGNNMNAAGLSLAMHRNRRSH